MLGSSGGVRVTEDQKFGGNESRETAPPKKKSIFATFWKQPGKPERKQYSANELETNGERSVNSANQMASVSEAMDCGHLPCGMYLK